MPRLSRRISWSNRKFISRKKHVFFQGFARFCVSPKAEDYRHNEYWQLVPGRNDDYHYLNDLQYELRPGYCNLQSKCNQYQQPDRRVQYNSDHYLNRQHDPDVLCDDLEFNASDIDNLLYDYS